MSAWRDDPDLIRQVDEDDLQRVAVVPEWEQLFAFVSQAFTGGDGEGSMWVRSQRAVLKGFLWQTRKRVAADPAGARAYVLDALRVVTACLRFEPLELYPDLKLAPQVSPQAPDASRADPLNETPAGAAAGGS